MFDTTPDVIADATEDSATPPPARPKRRRLRSLTSRLVVGVVSLVVVLVLATGAGTYFALSSFLYARLDQQLRSTADPTSLNDLFHFNPTQLLEPTVQAPQHVWAVALSLDGEVLLDPPGTSVKALKLSQSDRAALATSSTSAPRTVSTTDGLEMRVAGTQVTILSRATGASEPAIAVVGLSTSELRTTLRRLVALETLIGATAVLVALLATTYGVRFSLRRLYRVTATAQEVAAELSPEGRGLDRRVPVSDDGTEVGQLAESMNTLLAAVETQFAARLENEHRMRQFLADASHELRTPLTSIRGYAELARMQGAASDDLARIESEGTRMSRLVDDLLVLARSDQEDAPPDRHLIDVGEVLDEVVTSARAAFPDRAISLSAGPSLAVLGDQDQILRVVRNLVTNAANHTRPDGPISVFGGEEGEDVVVRIVDAGPGLPPEEAAHVFERFWRADRARSRARGGSGLGIAIVASLVRAHGGTVRFDSSVERGSTVTVRLPVATA